MFDFFSIFWPLTFITIFSSSLIVSKVYLDILCCSDVYHEYKTEFSKKTSFIYGIIYHALELPGGGLPSCVYNAYQAVCIMLTKLCV